MKQFVHSFSVKVIWICTVTVLYNSENAGVRLKYYRNYWSPAPVPHWSFIALWQQKCFMAVIAGDIASSYAAGFSERFIAVIFIEWKERSPLQEKPCRDQSCGSPRKIPSGSKRGSEVPTSSCPPSPWQAALPQASCCLPLPEKTAGSGQSDTQPGKGFLPITAFRLKGKPLWMWLMDGERQGNCPTCIILQSVEQSSGIDPVSTLKHNLEIFKAFKKKVLYINLISCISESTQLYALNSFWTKALLFSWQYSRQEFLLG